jgi:hypothetical protein
MILCLDFFYQFQIQNLGVTQTSEATKVVPKGAE